MRGLAAAALLPVLAFAQIDLKFEDGRTGDVPPGWFVLDSTMGLGYAATLQRDGCRDTAPCALLSAPDNPPPNSFGAMMRTLPAVQFRGRTVRLRAWIRFEKKEAGRAQMFLHSGRQGFQPGFPESVKDCPIETAQWAQYEIRGEVAPDAEVIQIGLTLHGAGRAWIGGVEFGPLAAEITGAAVDAARDAIRKQYERMDSAFVRGDIDEIGAVLMPGAQMGVGTIREPLQPAIQSEIAGGAKLSARTEVLSVRLNGDEAIVMIRREAHDPRPNGARSVITNRRDTWIQASNGWRLRESIEVSYHWIVPPTSAAAAVPIVAELKSRAVPVSGSSDMAAFGAAVGEARVVALGEAAHGTREFVQLKQRLVEYLVAQKGFTELVAAADDAVASGLADRLHVHMSSWKVDTPEVVANAIVRAANSAESKAKVILWTDNAHARDPVLRQKFGRKLYSTGFAFRRGEVRAVGVEKGESMGLGVYAAMASSEGSGDAVLSAAGIPQFFLDLTRVPAGGALAHWLKDTHLFHDLGAYWVLDDPDASLQPERFAQIYDGLYYVEEVHSGG